MTFEPLHILGSRYRLRLLERGEAETPPAVATDADLAIQGLLSVVHRSPKKPKPPNSEADTHIIGKAPSAPICKRPKVVHRPEPPAYLFRYRSCQKTREPKSPKIPTPRGQNRAPHENLRETRSRNLQDVRPETGTRPRPTADPETLKSVAAPSVKRYLRMLTPTRKQFLKRHRNFFASP